MRPPVFSLNEAILEALTEARGLPLHRQADMIEEAVCGFEMAQPSPTALAVRAWYRIQTGRTVS